MYRLTPNMIQRLKRDLGQYHTLFSAGRCSGWELEELIHRAIQSDNVAQHHSRWKEAGHDTEADIDVWVNGHTYRLQIKSGQRDNQGTLNLSGHRLGRFHGDLDKISAYLNNRNMEIVSVPYQKVEDDSGRRHCYQVCYIDPISFRGLKGDQWTKKGAQWRQTNEHGILFSLRPSMSWQIWWKIPAHLIECGEEFCIE